MRVASALAASALLLAAGCARRSATVVPAVSAPVRVTYTDATDAAGIRFRHDDGRKGPSTMLEQIGPGVGLIDYDGDGWLDLYFPNGRDRYGRGITLRNALYRNNRDGTFTDVTDKAGVPGTGYGFGVAVADYDNDGDADLFVCQYGKNVLYKNNGDGTFADATDAAGVGGAEMGEPFHIGAAWLDYDRDGKLDLFVARYVDFEHGPRYCDDRVTRRHRRFPHGCPPVHYAPTHCTLYKNNGDGTFTDMTRAAGVWLPFGKSLGVTVGDFNDDYWPDLYVANDNAPAYLLRNNADGTFTDIGLAAGVALFENGATMAAMGVDWGDFRNNGRLSLFVSDYQDSPNHLFENQGDSVFVDVAARTGLDLPSRPFLGFGGGFLDCDNDGWLDVFVANGHVVPEIGQSETGPGAIRYKQTPQLFRNTRRGDQFIDESATAGPAFSALRAGRGAVIGDLWNRGVADVVVAANSDRPLLLRHAGPIPGRHFVSLRLVGTKSNRDAIGARVTLVTEGGKLTQTREVKSSVSFLSSGELRLHFGVGEATRIDRVEIRWPLGDRATLTDLEADTFYTINEGEATARKSR